MKKTFTFLAIALMLLTCNQTFSQTDGVVTFTVRTVTNNDVYSPQNILAIWLEGPGNVFIRTFKVRAANRITHLYTWKVVSGMNTTDAITGPTLTNHTTHTITWNCRNLSNQLVPDGEYRIRVEFTEAHNQGPLANYTFVKGTTSQTINYPDQTYFKDAVLTYTVPTSVQDATIPEISVFPNPFDDNVIFKMKHSNNLQPIVLEIFDNKGNIIHTSNEFTQYNEYMEYRWSTLYEQNKLPQGTYFYRISNGATTLTGKLLKFK